MDEVIEKYTETTAQSSPLLKLLSSSVSRTFITNSTTSYPSAITSKTNIALTTTIIDFPFDGLDYTLDIVMPLIVGLLVALILGWMLIRYKMSAHERSNYNGSIYCCPERCFEFCAKFCECNLKFKLPKLIKRPDLNNPQIIVRHSDNLCNSSPIELAALNPKKTSPQRLSIRSNASSNGFKTPTLMANGNVLDLSSLSESSTTIQINDLPFIPQFLNSNHNNNNNNNNNNINYLNPSSALAPFRFLQRESFSSRRESFAIPDLMKSGNFSTNVFHSFQSKNSTTLA